VEELFRPQPLAPIMLTYLDFMTLRKKIGPQKATREFLTKLKDRPFNYNFEITSELMAATSKLVS
jgi:hypothetical protein